MEQVGCNDLIDYFNEGLDDVTKKKFEQHLSLCNSCQEELQELQALTEDLPFLSDPIEPPVEMKKRVLDHVFSQETTTQAPTEKFGASDEPKNTEPLLSVPKQKKNWLTPLLAASLLFSLLGNGYALLNQKESIQQPTAMDGLNLVNKALQLNPTDPATTAKVTAAMIQQDDGVALVIQGEQLQQLEGTEAYQVWLIEGDKKYRAGTFIPNELGEGAVAFPINYQGDHNWEMIAITLEPTPSSEQPLGDIVFSSEL
ncbi:anti-sigma factor [Bacillus mesophilus]|nr:anti-sigma factor [Bacillus mesophilus]